CVVHLHGARIELQIPIAVGHVQAVAIRAQSEACREVDAVQRWLSAIVGLETSPSAESEQRTSKTASLRRDTARSRWTGRNALRSALARHERRRLVSRSQTHNARFRPRQS